MYVCTRGLIASTVVPAVFPALAPEFTIEGGFSEFFVDLVVSVAQPVAEVLLAVDFGAVSALDPFLEVLGAVPARVYFGEDVHERCHIGFFAAGGGVRICGGHCM